MVTFPDLSSLSNNSDIGDILSLPNGTYPYFWAWILGALWLITASTLYFKGKERTGREKILSVMSVAAFAIMMLSIIGTVVGFIPQNIMIFVIVITFVTIGIWFFSD